MAKGQQLYFFSYSGWLLANFNKGVMLTGLEVPLISASTASFHLLHLFLALIIVCILPHLCSLNLNTTSPGKFSGLEAAHSSFGFSPVANG